MPYSKEDIQATTQSGIPRLADDIVKGIVDEAFAMQYLFKKLIPNLQTEVKKRREDEDIWNEALSSLTIEAFEKYLDIYNDDESGYIGRHIEEAESFKLLIQHDDEEWAQTRRANTADAYKHYLALYEKAAPSYRGKYVSKAHEALVTLQDDEDWLYAEKIDTLKSYQEYLTLYNNANSNVKGAHVDQAQSRIQEILDENDWRHACNVNTIDSYNSYLHKYSNLQGYTGKHIDEAKKAIKDLTPAPPEDPRIKDEEAWIHATKLNTISGYDEYLSVYDISGSSYKGMHVREAEMAKRALWDELEWDKAKRSKSIDGYKEYLSFCDRNSYSGYVWAHYNAAKTQIGNFEKQEEQRQRQEERRLAEEQKRILHEKDEAAWAKAIQNNTVKSYNEYLSSQPSGSHRKEANEKIRLLREQSAWQSACAYNTVDAYERYIQSFGNPTINPTHIEEAKQRIAKLKPQPPTSKPKRPIKWILGIITIFVVAWLGIMIMNNWNWPSNLDDFTQIFTGSKETVREKHEEFIIEEDSVQIAIDNHDLEALRRYAYENECRAYLPYACETWSQQKDTLEAVSFVRKVKNCPGDEGRPLRDEEADSLIYEIQEALNFTELVNHQAPPMPAYMGERLPLLAEEARIQNKAQRIAQKYGFQYTVNKEIADYIEDDFRRWVQAGDSSPYLPTKEDCYKAALQLKNDHEVRGKLQKLQK